MRLKGAHAGKRGDFWAAGRSDERLRGKKNGEGEQRVGGGGVEKESLFEREGFVISIQVNWLLNAKRCFRDTLVRCLYVDASEGPAHDSVRSLQPYLKGSFKVSTQAF